MAAFVLLSVPSEKSKIKLVPQNAIVNMALGNALAGFGAYALPQFSEGAIAVRVQLKNAFHDLGIFGMNLDGVFYFVVAIAEGRAAWIDALRGFLRMPFFTSSRRFSM